MRPAFLSDIAATIIAGRGAFGNALFPGVLSRPDAGAGPRPPGEPVPSSPAPSGEQAKAQPVAPPVSDGRTGGGGGEAYGAWTTAWSKVSTSVVANIWKK